MITGPAGILRFFSAWDPDAGRTRGEIWLTAGLYTILVFLPVLWLVFLGLGGVPTIGLSEKYDRIFRLAGNSFLFAGGSATLAILLGGAGALAVLHPASPWNFLRKWLSFTLFLPPYLYFVGWSSVFDFTARLTGRPEIFRLFFKNSAFWAVLIMALTYAPLVVLLLTNRINRLGMEYCEAANLMFPPPEAWKRIFWPLLRNSLAGLWLAVFILAVVDYGVPIQAQIPVIATQIVSSFLEGTPPLAVFLRSWVLWLPVTIIGVCTSIFFARIQPAESKPGLVGSLPLFHPNYWPRLPAPLIQIFLGILISGMILPLAGLFLGIFSRPWSSWSLAPAFPAMGYSFLLALASSLLAGAIASPLADFLGARKSGAGYVALFLPIAFPPALIGIAAAAFFNGFLPGIFQRYGGSLALAHLERILPFSAVYFLWSRLSTGRSATHDAAALEPGHRNLRFHLNLPILLGSWGMGFLLSLRELDVTLMTVPPGMETLPLRLFGLMHYGAGPEVCALGLFLFLGLGLGGKWLFWEHRS